MRRSVLLVVALAALLTAACASSDHDSGTSGADATADDSFCARSEQFVAAMARLEAQEATAADKVDAVADALGSADAPDDIADDLDAYLEGLERFADYTLDYEDDPSTATSFTPSESERYEAATARVMTYMQDTCGVTPP